MTLGPSCHDEDTLAALLEAGMTAARVDLTWGPLAYHKASLRALRAAQQRVKRMCAVMVSECVSVWVCASCVPVELLSAVWCSGQTFGR